MAILTEANRRRNKNRKKRPVPMAEPLGTRRKTISILDRRAADIPTTAKMENSDPYGQVGESILIAVTFI